MQDMDAFRDRMVRAEEYDFVLVLQPSADYREAVKMMEAALGEDSGEAAVSYQEVYHEMQVKQGAERRAKEGAGAGAGAGVSNSVKFKEGVQRLRQSLAGEGEDSPETRALKGVRGHRQQHPQSTSARVRGHHNSKKYHHQQGGKNMRLSLLDEIEEEERKKLDEKGAVAEGNQRIGEKRRRELERKKKQRLSHFVERLKGGIILRRHRQHRTSERVVLQSSDGCRTISWKPLVASRSVNFRLFGVLKREQQQESGFFGAATVTEVRPATDADPSHPGFFGTRNLRHSEDIPITARTFSLLFELAEGPGAGPHVMTLDLECESDVEYASLFQGFYLLYMERSKHHALRLQKQQELARQERIRQQQRIDAKRPTSIMLRAPPRHKLLRKSEPSMESPLPLSPKAVVRSISADPQQQGREEAAAAAGVSSPSSGMSMSNFGSNMGRTIASAVTLLSPKNRGGGRSPAVAAPIAPPPEYFLGWTSPGTQIWSRLRMAGLEVERLYGIDQDNVLLRIRLSQERLETVAEGIRLKLRRRDGMLHRFKVRQRGEFTGVGLGGDLFRSSESQKVIDHVIRSKIKDGGAELDETNQVLGARISLRMPLHNQVKLTELYNMWVTYWRPRQGYVRKPHTSAWGRFWADLAEFGVSMRRIWEGRYSQPLEPVAEYFGESIAFYFAWMGFYTRWLFFPSVFGIILSVSQTRSGALDHPLGPAYALFMICWASALLVSWRQHCSELAYRWGVLDYEVQETRRPQFRGVMRYDEVTMKTDLKYPMWKRLLKIMATAPVMLGLIAGTITVMFATFTTRDNVVGECDWLVGPFQLILLILLSCDSLSTGVTVAELREQSLEFWVALLLYPCLYGLLIPLLYSTCKSISMRLTNFENYKTESQFHNALILKVFSFRFVTVFAALYYYAFVSEGSANLKMLRLSASLLTFMTVGQWWYMCFMTLIPAMLQSWKLQRLRLKIDESRAKLEWGEEGGEAAGIAYQQRQELRHKLLDEAASPLWEESLLKDYDTFDDYTMSLIQFGYVTFFSMAFPLAPVLALVNNLIQMRVDAFKLCRTRRRPIARQVSGMGVWGEILQASLSLLTVVTNCALVGTTSDQLDRWIPGITSSAKLLLVVFAEHILLFLKVYWLESAVPRVPKKVMRALARERIQVTNRQADEVKRRASNAKGGPQRDEGGSSCNSTPLISPVPYTDEGVSPSTLQGLRWRGRKAAQAVEKSPTRTIIDEDDSDSSGAASGSGSNGDSSDLEDDLGRALARNGWGSGV
ncbi:unnamed protein product [Chrysoparadoxa australica]